MINRHCPLGKGRIVVIGVLLFLAAIAVWMSAGMTGADWGFLLGALLIFISLVVNICAFRANAPGRLSRWVALIFLIMNVLIVLYLGLGLWSGLKWVLIGLLD